jgi:hypothetical protein
VTAAGGIFAAFMTGLGLNSEAYGGTFSWDLTFNGVMGICAAFSLVTIPLCWWCITEAGLGKNNINPVITVLWWYNYYY